MRFILMLVVLLALSACLPFQKNTPAPIVDIGAAHEVMADISYENDSSLSVPDIGVVKVSGVKISGSAEAVRDEGPVVVPFFQVVFFTEVNPPESNDESKNNSENNVAVDARLIGITDATLQLITDQIYSVFIDGMKQHGIAILPMSSLEISHTYQKFVTSKIQSKQTPPFGLEATHVVPTGLRIFDSTVALDRGYASWEYGGSGNRARKNRGKEISNILNEMDASVMDVTFYVTHVKQRVQSTLTVVTDIEIEPMVRVRAGSRIQFYGLSASKCEGYCPNPVVNVALDRALQSSEKVGEMKAILKPSDKNEGFVAKTLSWLTLGSGVNRADIDHYELHADEQKYQQVVTEVLKEATDKLVAGFASTR